MDAFDSAPNLAIFCDFENVAIGVRDANYETFDIGLVVERLLDKGKIVVKKAYADWERYKSSRRALHEAAFELIEIPHVSYSGKNSADIRMVVDALDLCYTKTHVDVFVIVSGDSDFSPLVSKLRENNKMVIGLGVKNSSSDLLVENCDEFIYYDDLVRRTKAKKPKRAARAEKARDKDQKDRDAKETKAPAGKEAPAAKDKDAAKEKASRKDEPRAEPQPGEEELKSQALELVLDQVDSLFQERDDNLHGSMVKQTLKRKRPSFSESFHGYRSFNELIEDAARRELLEIQKDEKGGGYLITGFGPKA